MTIVTRYEFRKNPRKYMKLAEKETIIIVRNKMAEWQTGCVLIGWNEYEMLLVKSPGKEKVGK